MSTPPPEQRYPLHATHWKTGKSFYREALGTVAYEEHWGCLVVAGDPMSVHAHDAPGILARFKTWANARRKAACGYYFSADMLPAAGLRFYRAGVSSFVDLANFTTAGRAARDVRRALKKGDDDRLRCTEIHGREKDVYLPRLKQLEAAWKKSARGPRIGFLLSSPRTDFANANSERWFVVENAGTQRLDAMVAVLPYDTDCFYLDHMIQRPDGHRFALDFLLSRVILTLQATGGRLLSLGFNAFQGVQAEDMVTLGLTVLSRCAWLYNTAGIYRFKRKFARIEQPRYLALDPGYSGLRQTLALCRATYPGRRDD